MEGSEDDNKSPMKIPPVHCRPPKISMSEFYWALRHITSSTQIKSETVKLNYIFPDILLSR